MNDGAGHPAQNTATYLGLLEERSPVYRLRRDEPAGAYWALVLDDSGATLRLHVQNLRTLASEGAFIYQAWLTPGDGATVALPPFNTSLDGTGFCTIRARTEDVALGPGAELMVTAEPRHPKDELQPPVLAGAWANLPRVGPAQAAAAAAAAGQTAPAPEQAGLGQGTAPEAATPATGEPAPQPPADGKPPEGRDLFLRQTPPATPVFAMPPGYEPLEQAQELLTAAHDLAKGGSGLAVFDFPRNLVVISLDDVPSPDAFGQDPVTTRSFNVYAGWLLRRKAGAAGQGGEGGQTAAADAYSEIVPLGFFRRAGTGAYRLQARGAAQVTDYDTVLVSAEDRAGAFDPLERRVFIAPYSAFAPAGTSPAGV